MKARTNASAHSDPGVRLAAGGTSGADWSPPNPSSIPGPDRPCQRRETPREPSDRATGDGSRPLPAKATTRSVGVHSFDSTMGESFIDYLKRQVGFDASDAEALASLSEPLSPFLAEIIDQLHEKIVQDPRARATLENGPNTSRRLRQVLLAWLDELFCGSYDERYYLQRCDIGRSHVRAGLPQHCMFTAMSVVRQALGEKISAINPGEAAERIGALGKILDIDLAIINKTYCDDLVTHIEEVKHAQYERRLSESAHLATIGELAASLAHEIKNPLAGLSGAFQILGAGLDTGHPHQEIIGEALRQIDRLDAAVKDLLVYAKPRPPSVTKVDLNKLLERALILFRQEPAFRDVRVRCEGLNGEHVAAVDEVQMQQVISNLMINAAHACEQGGAIRCRISRLESSLRIVIEDDGNGMPPEVLSRIFEPFFTTKSRGTGLGLPICQRIVEAHGGTIDIASEVGVGTRVTVEVPSQP